MDTFSWVDINFEVKTAKATKQILRNVSGIVTEGDLVALMGPSGSGKTSLLNVLAGRIPQTSGSVFVNGRTLSVDEFRECTAYVQQEDALLGSLTVWETVNYTARLKYPNLSREAIDRETTDAIRLMGLWGSRETIVGTPLKKGLSGGQKRRLSVAVQLVTHPRILFLDEPTSGLDSAASFEVVRALKRLAIERRLLVIASIHQPSSATFETFDKVLLVVKGQTIFHGEVSEVVDFFDHANCPVPVRMNPAEHMLDVTNSDFNDAPAEEVMGRKTEMIEDKKHAVDDTQVERGAIVVANYEETEDYSQKVTDAVVGHPHKVKTDDSTEQKHKHHIGKHELASSVSAHNLPPRKLPPLSQLTDAWASSEFKTRLEAQLANVPTHELQYNKSTCERQSVIGRAYCCVRENVNSVYVTVERALVKAIRDPLAYLARFVMYIGLAVLIATTFLNIADTSQEGIQPRLNLMFFSSAFLSFMCVAYVPAFIEDLSVYFREKSSGVGSSVSLLLANMIVGLPFLFLTSLAFVLIIFWAVPLQSKAFWEVVLYLWLDLIAAESMVVVIVCILPNFVLGLTLSAFMNGLWMVVGGFLVAPNVLNTFWLHSFWYINYQRYVFFGLVDHQISKYNYDCAPAVDGSASCHCAFETSLASECKVRGVEVTRAMGFKSDDVEFVWATIGVILGMRVIAYIVLYFKSKSSM